MIVVGSPPRVRGKAGDYTPSLLHHRITPACAGKSIVLFLDDLVQQDHPRVCGEKRRSAPSGRPRWGSPPRVRGKACPFGLALALSRITPACAGKSGVASKICDKREDHPRVCGEKGAGVYGYARFQGSPPRVRGKEKDWRGNGGHFGITPACAGKRPRSSKQCFRYRDHPRVCGEKLPLSLKKLGESGSPPRVRGKGGQVLQGNRRAGITPACAGKRNPLLRHVGNMQDHPRVCGEKMQTDTRARTC